MVKSQINSNIIYSENKDLDLDDIHYSTSIYDYNIFDNDVEIALGKPKHAYVDKYNIINFSIYLIHNDEIISRIGVFETKSENVIKSVDENGNLNLSKGKIIIFITKEYFYKALKRVVQPKEEELEEEEKNIEEDENEIVLEDDPTELETKSKTNIDTMPNGDTWYVEDMGVKKNTLPEETQVNVNELKKAFTNSSKNTWIENYMKNNNFGIIDNEGGGDCLYAVLRDSFKDGGKITTVDKLRKIVSDEVTEETFKQYRSLYLGLSGNLKAIENSLKELKGTMSKLKKSLDSAIDAETARNLKQQIENLVTEYNNLLQEKKQVRTNMTEFTFMENNDTKEKLQQYMLTPSFWADTFAISTLEKKLNIKIIVLSEDAYDEKALDSVIQCGQLNDEIKEDYSPQHYIITSYNGKHYQLITYKEKGIFTFSELSFSVKSLILNKCLEKLAGPYYIINEFKDMKTNLNLDDEDISEDEEIKKYQGDLFENGEVFVFYSKSFNKPKPGLGNGEKTRDKEIYNDLIGLNHKDWRRMLDDSYIHPIIVDGKKWQTVKHFMLASQFKKTNEDIYNDFSLDNNADLKVAINIEDALKYSHENRKKVDKDFNTVTSNRKEEARLNALRSKFGESLKFKDLLKATKAAELRLFAHKGKSTIPDILLMQIRKEM